MILVGLAGSVDRFLNEKVVPGSVSFPPPLRKKAPGEKKKLHFRTILAPGWFLFDSILALWTCLVPGGGPGGFGILQKASGRGVPITFDGLLLRFWGFCFE